MKKILFILLLNFSLFGCMERLEVVSTKEKIHITEDWIINEFDYQKEKVMENIDYLKEKKKSDNSKIRIQAQKELEEWDSVIHNAQKKKERLEKERLDKFFNEFCYLLIKDNLRDPDSYKLDYVHYQKKYGNTYSISHSFRAKNGFGGYGKELETYEFDFTDTDLKSDVKIVVLKKRIELTEKIINKYNKL